MKRSLFAVFALVASLTGCAEIEEAVTPMCEAEFDDALVLVSQSVPSASLVPCIASYPEGWELNTINVRNGRTSMTFDNDRAGYSALKVLLESGCDVAGATEVATDEPGARRYEKIVSLDKQFRAERYYQFEGGCVTYSFNFSERGQALINQANLAAGFVTRDEIERRVRDDSDGNRKL